MLEESPTRSQPSTCRLSLLKLRCSTSKLLALHMENASNSQSPPAGACAHLLVRLWQVQIGSRLLPPGSRRAPGLRIYVITSPLQAKRPMQKLQSKLQVPRPNTASLSTGCQPSSVAKGTTWIMTRSASHEQMWHTAEPPTSPS